MFQQLRTHISTKKIVVIICSVILLVGGGAGFLAYKQLVISSSKPATQLAEASTAPSNETTQEKKSEEESKTETAPANAENKTPAQNSPASSTSTPSTPQQPAPTTPTPPPATPPPSGGCSGVAWSPGSSDPWGGCWPGSENTGVPSGVVLSAYTGPCTITTANTVIDAKTVNCVLSVRAAGVQITRSHINGGVDVPSDAPPQASFAISDSSIFIGDNLNTGLMRRNFTANRVDIMGGRRSVYCASNCTVENSWVHAQGGDPAGAAHFSGMRMEQYTTYRHNSITCEATRVPGSGCSAGLTGYGDFAPIQNNLIERNLFYRGGGGGSTACAYGGSSGDDGSKPYGNQAMNIRFIGNRFVRSDNGLCGNLRTIIDFNAARPGNQWIDNSYHDGGVLASGGP